MVEPAFLLELGGIVVGLAILARIAGRWQLPAAPLFLLAGLAFGRGGVFPLITAGEFVELGAEIGVILLLFMLGLEYSASELTAGLRRHAPAGVVDLLLNFPPGFIAALALGWGLVAAVFLGGITYISSSGIVARLLDDLCWVGNREAPIVISILVIEDLVMAGYLSLIAVLVSGVGFTEGVVTLILALGAVAALLVVAQRWGHVVSDHLFSRSDQTLVLSVLGITFLVAGFAELVGISAAVGAFLVGLMLSGPSADRAHDLLGPMRDLFAAIFFVFFGLSIDPSTIPPILGVAALLGVVTIATKTATGWWSARREGVRTRGRFRAGAALIARGEFSIAIAGIGAAGGVEPEIASLAGAYVLITAVTGPLIARVIDPVVQTVQARSATRAARSAADRGA
ncbi:MAG: cation:proton antiporter [Actinomycetota bacterium]